MVIGYEPEALPEDVAMLGARIDAERMGEIGHIKREYLTFFIRDEDGKILGGIHGNTGGGWLYISAIWVSKEIRGRGYGSALMRAAEDVALKRTCTNAYLDTFSFQAPGFYTKLGYSVFAELEAFPDDHHRIFFRKQLINSGG